MPAKLYSNADASRDTTAATADLIADSRRLRDESEALRELVRVEREAGKDARDRLQRQRWETWSLMDAIGSAEPR